MLDFDFIRQKQLTDFTDLELQAYYACLSLLPLDVFQTDSMSVPDLSEFNSCIAEIRARNLDLTAVKMSIVKTTKKSMTEVQEVQLQFTQRCLTLQFPELRAQCEADAAEAERAEAEAQAEKLQKAIDAEQKVQERLQEAERKLQEREQKAQEKAQKALEREQEAARKAQEREQKAKDRAAAREASELTKRSRLKKASDTKDFTQPSLFETTNPSTPSTTSEEAGPAKAFGFMTTKLKL